MVLVTNVVSLVLSDWEKQGKSERVLPQVRCEHRYTDEHLRSQDGQTKIVYCFRFLVSTGGLTDIQTKLVLCYSALLTAHDLV